MASASPPEPIWYLTDGSVRAQGWVAGRFEWFGQSFYAIAEMPVWGSGFTVREEHAVAFRPEDSIGFQSPEDDLSAEIGDIVLPR